ncbi:Photosystem I reaction centre subunit N [Theobroma cacao]|nr:Photosystem I reaction centre subunit N [Theobroma cacao]
MAAMNSSVLACNYAISGTGSFELNAKLASVPSVASPVVSGGRKLPVIRAQQAKVSDPEESRASEGRRAAMLYLAATLFTTAAASSANASVFDEYLEKSKANKELNDKKRLATSGANFARAYTVQFGTCKFPENFTGCQDLAKQKKVPFISDDLELECEGKDKYKCGSNVFWKWNSPQN